MSWRNSRRCRREGELKNIFEVASQPTGEAKMIEVGKVTVKSVHDWEPEPGSVVSWGPITGHTGQSRRGAGESDARQLHAGRTSAQLG